MAVPAPTSLDQVCEWIEGRLADQAAGQRLPFAVIYRPDGNFAGSTGYASISRKHHTLEIASWYGLEYQRTGVNTECKYLLLKHAFEELGALRVGLKWTWKTHALAARWSVSAGYRRVSCANTSSGAMVPAAIRLYLLSLMMTAPR